MSGNLTYQALNKQLVADCSGMFSPCALEALAAGTFVRDGTRRGGTSRE